MQKINGQKNKMTYVSLFSSAGIGCYGFKMEGFECIATNELLEKRLAIQKCNNKCKYDSGYISGDITKVETQNKILNEIKMWKEREGIKELDVLMATPPCQGMSTANYKKNNEINRNSLVVEAIHLIELVNPRVFVFENVRAFLKTLCIDKDEEKMMISDCIKKHLSKNYNIFGKVINFMDYGVPSSRPRTLVIGTRKDELNFTPLNIFPLKENHISLREAIGNLESLKYGERSKHDLYHSFRKYPIYMQDWIHNLKEGETAFNNPKENRPYKIVNGTKQLLKSGHMGNKFRRMFWNNPAPCITTRNDQLASQTTIHPSDDRVLTIRELMKVMTIPETFKWLDAESQYNIDKNENLIRQSIGEAVPTHVIDSIAKNIKIMLEYDDFVKNYDKKIIYKCNEYNNFYIKSYIYEMNIANQKSTGSFYTPQSVVYNTIKDFSTNKLNLRVLEPSVGCGAFLPQFLRLVDDCESCSFDLVDISDDCLKYLEDLLTELNINKKIKFNFICDDFITHEFSMKYDAIISNPPYFKILGNDKKRYKEIGIQSDNIFCYFLKKYADLSDDVMCIIPKTFLMIPDCNDVRNYYQNHFRVSSIHDYGVHYFKDVFVEIISIVFTKKEIQECHIINFLFDIDRVVPYDYIYHDTMWLIYRDSWFDNYIKKLNLNIFDFYRDRQLTNKYLTDEKEKYWVIRSKNVLDNGEIIHKEGYDKYTNNLNGFLLKKYLNKKHIIFTNFTYNTRATILPDNCVINGSMCILLPKKEMKDINLNIYSSNDFRKYYAIVKNLSKFTINIDSNSIYYIGAYKND